MTTYRIEAPHFVAAIIASSDTVLESAPILRWAVGRSLSSVLDYCRKRGWSIEPLPDDDAPYSIEYGGDLYEFHQSGGKITRITLHESGEMPRDLRYNQLPVEIKKLL